MAYDGQTNDTSVDTTTHDDTDNTDSADYSQVKHSGLEQWITHESHKLGTFVQIEHPLLMLVYTLRLISGRNVNGYMKVQVL